MSGGHLTDLQYSQFRINDLIEGIERELEKNLQPITEDDDHRYSEETIAEFKTGLDILRKAFVYAHRIDYLVSGDDGEESFHERLKEELEQLKT